MEQFQEQFFVDYVRDVLAPQYYRYPAVQGMFELDDLVMDVVLWYYQPTRAGIRRLDYYMSQCNNDLKHFYNHLKRGLSQYIPALLRYNFMKNIPISLNVPIDRDDESAEFMDLIVDKDESPEDKVLFDNMLKQIAITVKEDNLKRLYNEARQNNKTLGFLEFRLMPMTIITAGQRTNDQISLLSDLMSGFKATELRLKYSNYDKLLYDLRMSVHHYYEEHGTTVKEVLGIRKVA